MDVDRSVITFGDEYASTTIACHPPDHVDIIPSAATYEARRPAPPMKKSSPSGPTPCYGPPMKRANPSSTTTPDMVPAR
ncbi:hypothetical protein [Streptomyces justiciae]|uniref:hypothetical protein n=1 Tax=Streptomyces justiciae TaxID=2780140 RepID=UPI001880E898|nr:hypothetical protein [Streptomyces justiciae]MBE8471329.1 hypothetical protein [Streptomyces justiciae]MCW8377111.1 hypothetical protein [Streptomyces justiciae]